MSNLKEIHVTDTNLRLDNNIVKGGILPNKISELSRTVNVVGETVVEGPLYANKLTIESAPLEVKGAVFTHVSNVFGYVLPVAEMAKMCREKGIPFIIDAAQSAGHMKVSMKELGADFIAMPGHKGLLGPMGTGLLLCNRLPEPMLMGGTGSESRNQKMPDFLPDRGEAGTVNVPGIAGLGAGILYLQKCGVENVERIEKECAIRCAEGLRKLGFYVFSGEHQGGTISFLPGMDCEEGARLLAGEGIAVRAGLHCAPLAHETAGTLETGTIRVSFGMDRNRGKVRAFLRAASKLRPS